MSHPVPVSPEALSELLSELIVGRNETRLRVAIDGADAADPGRLADSLVVPLRAAGFAVARVHANDFLRGASVRFEYGKTDPDSFYDLWLDANGLTREVLTPWGVGGRYLPALWDAVTDRAVRAAYEPVPARGVLLVDGPLLLGRGLPFDLAVHVRLSGGALRRRTSPDEAWTLPAFERYEDEVDPTALADVVIRADDARHPAVLVRGG
ncbi:uridine kinase [Cryptosporangium phraense]|uniref:Uridine kinase n=1 Tax=Cryptosporangium phraense TaxID=2593070 RepID=A0A545ALW6_9ACTN|nr:uridine kinase [Cryptosporangium phraense]TQS42314.1 uridine kinase [Cryptosporangium phraense]